MKSEKNANQFEKNCETKWKIGKSVKNLRICENVNVHKIQLHNNTKMLNVTFFKKWRKFKVKKFFCEKCVKIVKMW